MKLINTKQHFSQTYVQGYKYNYLVMLLCQLPKRAE